MKEFEKQFGTKEEALEGYGWRDIGEYFDRLKGWEAALEWAKTQKVERRVLELNGTIIQCTDILPRAIEEELETEEV